MVHPDNDHAVPEGAGPETPADVLRRMSHDVRNAIGTMRIACTLMGRAPHAGETERARTSIENQVVRLQALMVELDRLADRFQDAPAADH